MKQRIYNKPGYVQYIKYYDSIFASWAIGRYFIPPRIGIVLPNDKPRDHYGDILEKTDIPNLPIRIKIEEDAFQTSDGAVIDLLFEIEVAPKIDGNPTLAQIEQCVPAYQQKNKEGEDQLQGAAKWIESQIRFVLKVLKRESFLSIAWADCKAGGEMVTKFKYLIEKMNSSPETVASMHQLQEMENRLKLRIKEIEDGKNLSKVVEEIVSKKIEAFNFSVQENSCSISIKNLTKDGIRDQDLGLPGNQPIIEYLDLFHIVQEKLMRHKEEFEVVLLKLKHEYDQKKKEAELENKKLDQIFLENEKKFEAAIEKLIGEHENTIKNQKNELNEKTKEIETQHKLKIAEINNKYKETDDQQKILELQLENNKKIREKELEEKMRLEEYFLEQKNAILKAETDNKNKVVIKSYENKTLLDLNELDEVRKKEMISIKEKELESLEKEVELSKREDEANATIQEVELSKLNRENELEKAKIKNKNTLQVEKIEAELEIVTKQRELPNQLEDIPYSVDQLQELKIAEGKLKIQEIQNEANKLSLNYQREEEKLKHYSQILAHELKRELRQDELSYDFLQKSLEQELLIAYTNLNNEEKIRVINSIGENLANSIKSAEGLNPDIKILGFPNNTSDSPVLNFLQEATKTLLKSSPWIENVNELIAKHFKKNKVEENVSTKKKKKEGIIEKRTKLNKEIEVEIKSDQSEKNDSKGLEDLL